MGSSLNRACDQLRKERNKQCEVEKRMFGWDLSTVAINGIAKCLEGIKAYSYRKYNMESGKGIINSDTFNHCRKAGNEKIIILEYTKDSQVGDDTYCKS